ncbi:MAG: hypothetical protein RR860_05815, partial [Janthinobacterium sp.]
RADANSIAMQHVQRQRINNTRHKSLLPGIVNIGISSVCWCRLNGAARAPSPPHSWPAELEAGHAFRRT